MSTLKYKELELTSFTIDKWFVNLQRRKYLFLRADPYILQQQYVHAMILSDARYRTRDRR